MKKTLAVLVVVCMGLTAFAQRSNINSAYMSLKKKEYQEALKYINEAVNDPSTKDDPKAWFYRGNIYMEMQNDPGYAGESPYRDAVESYLKVAELKSNYETDDVNRGLLFGAYNYYNEAIAAYNSADYDNAYNLAGKTVYIGKLDAGKRFAGNSNLDTVIAAAQMIQGMSAYQSKKYDKAEPILVLVKEDPIESKADIFLILADLYRKQEQTKKELAILTEARKRYPSNTNIRNEELNYYIRTKQQDLLIQKLEEAVTSEPENAIYQYNLANAYTKLAFPEDGAAVVPADKYDMWIVNAEKGYIKAIELAPANIGYHYDMGVLYYNQAAQVTNKMNDLGTTPEDDKKYKEYQTLRNSLFGKALPELNKVYDAFKAESSLSTEEKIIYQSTIVAMYEIYARQNNAEKAAEIKAELDALK